MGRNGGSRSERSRGCRLPTPTSATGSREVDRLGSARREWVRARISYEPTGDEIAELDGLAEAVGSHDHERVALARRHPDVFSI